MSVIPLNTFLPEFGQVTHGAAERWIAAALAHASALHEYDRWLYPSDPAKLQTAEQLHAAWQRWVDDAQTVFEMAEAITTSDREIPGLSVLRDDICRIQCMLQMTPALIARRHEQVDRGEVYSAEEVRRELRAGRRW